MKYKLEKPVILPEDIIKLRSIAIYYGYELVIDDEKNRYFVLSDESIGYIQSSKNGLFIIWKNGERIQYVKDIIDISQVLKKHNVIPEPTKSFNSEFITGLQNLLRWIPGVTIKEELKKCQR